MSTETDQIFVGRQEELRALDAWLLAARQAKPGIVFIEGTAGIGKSALVRRFVHNAQPMPVLRASGERAEITLAYGLVSQISSQSASALAGELLTLTLPPPSDPLVVGSALLHLLGAVQGKSGVLLVIEDLHWGDLASCQALLFALRRLRADRVLALITYRSGGLGRLGEGWRRMITDDERCLRIRLTGLEVDDIVALSALLGVADLSPASARRILEHTAGNTLYVRALLEETPAEVLRQPNGPMMAPPSVSAAILARLAGLSPEGRRLVQAAAVLGGRPALSTASTLAGNSNAWEALEEARQAGLLNEASTHELVFPHALIRSAVYEDLGPTWRSALHRKAAELLDGEAALAHRVQAAAGFDSTLADRVEAAAREKEANNALLQAAALWRQASSLSSARRSRERRLLTAVDLMLNGGDATGAEAMRATVEHCSDGLWRDYVLGYLAFLSGRAEEAERLLTAAWTAPQSDPDALMVRVSAAVPLCRLLVVQGRSAEAIAYGRHALTLLPESATQRARIIAMLVTALIATNRWAQAWALVERLAPIQSAPTMADQWVARGMLRLFTDDLTGAIADLSQVVEAARWGLRIDNSAQAIGFLAEAEYRAGRWDQAIAHTELVVSFSHDSGRVWDFAFTHGIAALPRCGRGDWPEAQAHVHVATQEAAAFGAISAIAWAAHARATLAWTRRDYQDVLDATEPLLGHSHGGVGEPGILAWRTPRAAALVELGRLHDAEHAVRELEELSAARDLPSAMLDAARVRGCLEAARGDTPAAKTAFARGAQILPRVPMPLNRAEFHLAHGRLLRELHKRQAAARELRAAYQIFLHLGARPFIEQSEQEFITYRLRPRHTDRRDLLGLTNQELAIVRLVAAGKRNREVASELYVTTKTVEYHLANVYTKLGIANRVELAARFQPAATQH